MMRSSLLAMSIVTGSCLIGANAYAQLNLEDAVQETVSGAIGTLANPITGRAVDGTVNGSAQVSGNANTAGNATVTGNVGDRRDFDANSSSDGRSPLFGSLRSALQRAEDGTMRLGRELQESIGQLGLLPGDQLLDANGQPLQEANVDQYFDGRPAELRVLRNGNRIVIRDFANRDSANRDYANSRQGRPMLGIAMNPSANGVVITEVSPNGAAARAGLRTGDEIISVNGRIVGSPDAMIHVVTGLRNDEQVAIQYRRNGQVLQALVTLSANSQFANDPRYPYASPSVQRKLEQIERLLQEVRQELAAANVYPTGR